MKILIIGDSWGLGSYKFADDNTGLAVVPNTGPEFFFTEKGYEVNNLSISGGSNVEQFDLLKNVDADIIVWFHTETNRDILKKPLLGFTEFKKLTEQAAIRNYDLAQTIYDNTGKQFILIGCLSPIGDVIKNYTFPKYVIKSWLSELHDQSLPLTLNVHSDYMQEVIEKYHPSDLTFITEEIDNMMLVEDTLEHHPAFSDGVHPTYESFQRLVERLHLIITSNN